MTPEGLPSSLTSLDQLRRGGKIEAGSFVILHDPGNNGVPYGTVRQIVSMDRGGCFTVSAICFDAQSKSFQRIDKSPEGYSLQGIPIRMNILRVADERSIKMHLLNRAIGSGDVDGKLVDRLMKLKIPQLAPDTGSVKNK